MRSLLRPPASLRGRARVQFPVPSQSACRDLQAGKQRIDQLTGYLAHALVVLAAVSGFLTVGVTVAHRFPAAVLKALVVAAGAAVGTLPLPAARLGRRDQLPAEKRQISTNDKAEARRTPSTRTHDGNFFPPPLFFFFFVHLLHAAPSLLCCACVTTDAEESQFILGRNLSCDSFRSTSSALAPRRSADA